MKPRRQELNSDPRVRPLLQEVMQLIDPELLDGVDAEQERTALALIQTSLGQAIDLMENPARAPGWSYADPVILESQGQVSRQIVRGINKVAAQRLDLGAALQQRGAFLDVGTGVGWIAIEAARSWPALAGRWHRLMGAGIGPRAQEPLPERHHRARRASFAEGRAACGLRLCSCWVSGRTFRTAQRSPTNVRERPFRSPLG